MECAGLRHTELHLPATDPPPIGPPLDTPAPPAAPATAAPTKDEPAKLKRVATCPRTLAALSAPALVKREFSKRNHRPFLDLYELGAVVGTGGYAVVRECVHRGSGKKYAAKMMTVSDAPESGGRDIDRTVRTRCRCRACTSLPPQCVS